MSTNRIALISTKANLYPIQFRVPPRKVRRLPHVPGTVLVSGGRLRYRSGLYSPASGPQIVSDVLTERMAAIGLNDGDRHHAGMAHTDEESRPFLQVNAVHHLTIPADNRGAERDHDVFGHGAHGARHWRVQAENFVHNGVQIW